MVSKWQGVETSDQWPQICSMAKVEFCVGENKLVPLELILMLVEYYYYMGLRNNIIIVDLIQISHLA